MGQAFQEELAKILPIRVAKKAKEMRKEFAKAVREELGEDIEEINRIYGTEYQDYDELIDKAISGEFYDEDGVIAEARKGLPAGTADETCMPNPHMVLVPLKTGISMGNDSKANARLRQLFVLIVLALTLHSSVMLLEEGMKMLEESCPDCEAPLFSGIETAGGKRKRA